MAEINDLSDEAIVELVRSSDPELYVVLVKRYQHKLIRYAQTMVDHYDQATEVVQEAFINAYQNLNSFKTHKKFSSWLYRIVHNSAINEIKKHAKEHSLDQLKWPVEVLKHETNLEKEFETKEIKQQLDQFLKQLPFKYRQVLILKYYENKSYEEMSDILHLPLGTVGTYLDRGKKLLAHLYQQESL